MIAYIKGTAAYAENDTVVLDHQGMGYQIRVPSTALEQIHMGQEITLHTYLYVREDALALYGFLTKEELRLFRLLLGVNGVGPRVALAVLSALSVEDLYYAVVSEDAKSIAKTPGIGPKGAKRMIIELKDKLDLRDLGIDEDAEMETEPSVSVVKGNDAAAETIEALMVLGYSNGEAYRAVHRVKGYADMDTEELLGEALKVLV
ncbi:MAG: Holliday junction branch migration protein RuvA [Clostridiales bacterium]|nr:Holliday junction branch migration protein RuvA [Clostridiales bacterium]